MYAHTHIHITGKKPIKKPTAGQKNGSVGKRLATKADNLIPIPGSHMVKNKKELPEVVLRLHALWHMDMHSLSK